MKKTRRVLGILLALVMLFGVAACGDKAPSNDGAKLQDPGKEQQEQEDGEPAGSDNNGEIPVITWYIPAAKTPDFDMVLEEINKLVYEKLGCYVDIIPIDSGTYGERLNLIINSNEEFDLCFTSNWLNDYSANVAKGAFLPLDDLVENHPTLKGSVPEYMFEGPKMHGSLYAIPNYLAVFYEFAIAIQQKYVDEFNFDISTVKELKDVEPLLAQIKETHPDVIPYCADWTPQQAAHEYITAIFYLSNRATLDDYKVELQYEREGQLDEWKMFHDWYKKGYIPSDILTNRANYPVEQIAVTIAQMNPGTATNDALIYGETRAYITIEEPYVSFNNLTSSMTAISVNSKNPELAMDVLELFYTDKEVYNMLIYGVEGVHYKLDENQQVETISDGHIMDGVSWMTGNELINAYVKQGVNPEVGKKTDEVNRSARPSAFLGFGFDTSNVSTELSALNAVYAEFSFLTYGAGDDDVEKQAEEFKSKMESAGAEAARAELQRQLEEFVASKK